MNKHALQHIQKSNYAYGIDEKSLCVRLRVAKDDMTKVEIIYADKFDIDSRQAKDMKKILSDALYDYYEAEITIEQNRYVYYFKLYDETESIYFHENGCSKDFDEKIFYYNVFQFPYLHKVDLHEIPSWSKEAVFYQIFVERFFDGDASNNPENLTKWGTLPTSKSYYGGDLKGIIQKLDYIEELGINAIYLTPIFTADTNHKYDTSDYMQIDPGFGNTEVLKELVQEAHKRGIKIVLDAVFNHSGYQFAPFQDVLAKGKESKYFNWFHIDGDKVTTNPSNYLRFAFCDNMPKLNTNNEEVQDYLLKVATYWIEQCDIDGWRLDVSDEVDHAFWRKFRAAVKKVKKEAIILGENWHNAYAWLQGDQYDGVMNYAITKACLDYFAHHSTDARQFSYTLSEVLMRNTEHANNAMLNLLDSHDTSRLLTVCEGDKGRVKAALTFLLTFVGMPCTYYGTEIAMEGNHDPDCRRTFDWDRTNWDMDYFDYYKKLIYLRRNHKALQVGKVSFRYESELFIMERSTEHEKIVVVINQTDAEKEVVFEAEEAIELLSEVKVKGKLGQCVQVLAPNTNKIYSIKY